MATNHSALADLMADRVRKLASEARYAEAADAARSLASYQRRHDLDHEAASKLTTAFLEVQTAQIKHRAFNAKAKRCIKLMDQL